MTASGRCFFINVDYYNISGMSDDSNIDEKQEPGNSLLEGEVEDDNNEGDLWDNDQGHVEVPGGGPQRSPSSSSSSGSH